MPIAKSVARRASSASRSSGSAAVPSLGSICSSDEMRVGRSGRNKGHPPWTDGSVDGVAQFEVWHSTPTFQDGSGAHRQLWGTQGCGATETRYIVHL